MRAHFGVAGCQVSFKIIWSERADGGNLILKQSTKAKSKIVLFGIFVFRVSNNAVTISSTIPNPEFQLYAAFHEAFGSQQYPLHAPSKSYPGVHGFNPKGA